jgi:DNA-binding NarL/FixJ family response regulator
VPEDGDKPGGKVVKGPWPSLEEEEFRVLKLLSEGHTTQEIADRLGVSRSAARRRIELVLDKQRSRSPFDPIPPLEA